MSAPSDILNTHTTTTTQTPKMPQLDTNRRTDLIEAFAEQIVDGMDTKTLMQFAYDVICENLTEYSDLELAEDVSNHFGDDVVDFVEEVLTQEEVDYYFKG